MIVHRKEELARSSRAVTTAAWSTVRLLLAEDGAGFTLTDVVVRAGSSAIYGYKHHVEACYCLEGRATLEELATGIVHEVGPGFLWAATEHERFRFTAHEPTRLISVFVPPLTGREVNDAEGSFPPAGNF